MVEVGTTITARVTRIEPYGVWLEFQGEKVLVLVPYLSWTPVHDPFQFVRVGQDLKVKVIRYNYVDQVIVGSCRALEPEKNPYRDLSLLKPGLPLDGKVVFMAGNDISVELPNHVWGNIPKYRLRRELKMGEMIQVVISALDVDEGKLTLDLVPREYDSAVNTATFLVPTS